MKLNEDKILANADYLYSEACNQEYRAHHDIALRLYGPHAFGDPVYKDKEYTIGPRSTRAAIKAIVRGINEMLENDVEQLNFVE